MDHAVSYGVHKWLQKSKEVIYKETAEILKDGEAQKVRVLNMEHGEPLLSTINAFGYYILKNSNI